jgi:hypothetical protein
MKLQPRQPVANIEMKLHDWYPGKGLEAMDAGTHLPIVSL